MTIDAHTLYAALDRTLDAADLPELGETVRGKVRDAFVLADGRRVLVTTDRISAFDRVLGTLPLKGQVLNRLSAWWFEQTRDVAPNHLLSVPDPNVTVATDCTPLPVEWVMRAYLTGVTSTSIWTHYEKGARTFCGHPLPDGLQKHDALPKPILTPSTKAEKGGHDESVSKDELLRRGVISPEDLERAAAIAELLFARGQAVCAARGLILVDTKYELGKTPDGEIVVIDEVHTPDSSRFWFANTYDARMSAGEAPESFDKEYVRRWLAERGYTGDGPPPRLTDEVRVEAARRYVEACETIRGEPFEADLEEPMQRIRKNLADLLGPADGRPA